MNEKSPTKKQPSQPNQLRGDEATRAQNASGTGTPDTGTRATSSGGGRGGSLWLRWFINPTVRQALQMAKHVRKLVHAQRDLLKPEHISAVNASAAELRATAARGDNAAIQAAMENLEKVANNSLRPYPMASVRENVEVLLVAIAVAMGIRTFVLQPFKIPTGSMQPTLWGITANPDHMRDGVVGDDLRPNPDFEVPNFLKRFVEYWVNGVSYTHVVAKSDGAIRAVEPQPSRLLIFDLRQSFWVGNESYTVWFPPDNMFRRAGLVDGYGKVNPREFKKGEDILKMRSVSGDHLFVDRVTYNFRPPTRGEIVVFETKHVQHSQVPTDQFYIKRLVGLGDETLSISPNRRLVVNGRELTPSTPRFENLYGYHPEHKPNDYFGHVTTELLANGREYAVPHNHFFVMGDNTMNSLDSRYWGGFPREDLVGKAYFVYWPISSRFGWGYR
jgi:signal peptidase I